MTTHSCTKKSPADDDGYASAAAIAAAVLLPLGVILQTQQLSVPQYPASILPNLQQSNKSQLIIPDHFSLSMDKSKSMRLRLAQFLAEVNRYKEAARVPPLRTSPL